MRIDKINLQGEVFEELTVTAKVTGLNDNWLLQCSCGKYLQVKGWMFRKRKLFCCGCLKYPRRIDHPLWQRWHDRVKEGSLCEGWKIDFWQFERDVSPYDQDMVIIRLDKSKPLGLGNFKWSNDCLETARHRTFNKKLTLETDSGRVYLHDWACGRGLQPHYARVVTLYNQHFVTEESHMLELVEKDWKINSV